MTITMVIHERRLRGRCGSCTCRLGTASDSASTRCSSPRTYSPPPECPPCVDTSCSKAAGVCTRRSSCLCADTAPPSKTVRCGSPPRTSGGRYGPTTRTSSQQRSNRIKTTMMIAMTMKPTAVKWKWMRAMRLLALGRHSLPELAWRLGARQEESLSVYSLWRFVIVCATFQVCIRSTALRD